MKLHVIYKGQTVDISYDLLYINADEVNIRFSNSNAQSCKFLTQYLEANRLDYVLKDREDYKEIVVLPDIFALTLSTKGAYRSPVVKDNLYDAIIERSNDIELARNAIREFNRNVKEIDARLADMQDDLSKSEYARSIDNITKEILEFKRCKQLEDLALAEEHLNVPRGTIPTVETLEVAYEVSTLFKLEDFAKLLYIYGYLEDQSKLSKKYQKVYDTLGKLEKYMYPEYVKDVEALGQNLLAELQEKAAKWAENEPNISEWIREICRQFGFEIKSEEGDLEMGFVTASTSFVIPSSKTSSYAPLRRSNIAN